MVYGLGWCASDLCWVCWKRTGRVGRRLFLDLKVEEDGVGGLYTCVQSFFLVCELSLISFSTLGKGRSKGVGSVGLAVVCWV